MEVSSLRTLDEEEEKKSLEGLLNAFGSVFSLQEIASAYCKAKRDVDLAGVMLCDLRHNTSNSFVQVSNSSCEISSASPCISISEISSHTEGNSKTSEPRNHPISGGCCGYDMPKSITTLLDLSTVSSEKTVNSFGASSEVSTDTCQKSESLSHVEGPEEFPKTTVAANTGKGPKDSGQMVSALFHAPQRPEEFPKTTIADDTGKRPENSGQMVVEPLRDITVDCKTRNINAHNDIEGNDKEDSYQALRKAVREYRATMNEYYKAAVDAFGKGDHALAGRLMDEGQFYHGKAREADEESVGMIFEDRNEETEETVSLDLHDQGAREAISLLKSHLSSLSGIPSMKFLKVITEMNGGEISKRTCKRLIIKLLKKESISWIEGENPGTILIRLDEIDPKRLSFARK
ncbi:putative nuclear RNA export factor SDE5 isoform X1 [Actinidia eriantha]|uniref:putative nuclear RNA export factor SDE5 isoform X1 n=1 Tax=Actinidia eriantha TaxID=165200 RepID=UPI00258E26E5|nr:putative nuclear RNA export factor SDE5 isoform X1 [Actinidia eriantha]XP_057513693.1 putative nuclear RNA export factor SDE5 isoform X1 [Actinidia eriantha]